MESVIKNLPSIYKTAVLELEEDLKNAAENDVTKNGYILDFADSYWLLPHYWNQVRCDTFDEFGVAVNTISWNNKEILEKKCQRGFDLKEVEKVLGFPCEGLEEIFEIYSCFSTKPLTKSFLQKYQTALNLRAEIKASESNIDKFLTILNKLTDNELIVACYEYFLLSNYTNNEIWKNYINFLNTFDKKKSLMAYKHYTRFFIEDKEMVKVYREKIDDVKNVAPHSTTFWMADTIDWEFQFGVKNDGYTLLEDYVNSVLTIETMEIPRTSLAALYDFFYITEPSENVATNLKFIFSCFEPADGYSNESDQISEDSFHTEMKSEILPANFKNAIKQSLDFSSPILKYAFDNVRATVLQKLYQTCKYFFATFKTPICYRMIIGGSKTAYFEQSMQISETDLLKPVFHQLIRRIKIVNCLQWNSKNEQLSIFDIFPEKNISEIKHVFYHGMPN